MFGMTDQQWSDAAENAASSGGGGGGGAGNSGRGSLKTSAHMQRGLQSDKIDPATDAVRGLMALMNLTPQKEKRKRKKPTLMTWEGLLSPDSGLF